MGSRTEKQRQLEENIKKKIMYGRKAGYLDKNGAKLVSPNCGTGHTNRCICLWGPTKLNIWPRDENGNLIGGD